MLKEINNFRLVALNGPDAGKQHKISKELFTIGRSPQADVQIMDDLLSRVHAQFQFQNHRWYLEDLNSTNGTWLLGQPVKGKVYLPFNTSFCIGKSVFELRNVLLTEEYGGLLDACAVYRVTPDAQTPASVNDMVAGKSLNVDLSQDRALSAIYRFQNSIAAAAGDDDLYHDILQATLEAIPADAAYLFLYDIESGALRPEAGLSPAGPIQEANERDFNLNLIALAKENKEAVLAVAPLDGDRTASAICSPLVGHQQLNGALYLKLTDTDARYTEDDLRLVSVMSHIAGMAVEHARILKFNLKNERLVATGTVAAELSHCIKNFLSGLEGSIKLLKLGYDKKDFGIVGESWNILCSNHRRLGALMQDLLSLSSELKPKMESCDILEILTEVVELLRPQFDYESLAVEIEAADAALIAEADRKGLHRVFLNLLGNAEHAVMAKQEHVDQGTGRIVIKAGYDKSRDNVVIQVSDNGVGLDAEQAKRVFELYNTTKGAVGTGLGLSVCKKIVEAHCGSIDVQGEPGKGCAITVALPVNHNEANTNTTCMKYYG